MAGGWAGGAAARGGGVYLGLGQQQDVGEEVDVELFLLLPRQHVDETAPASIDDDEEGGGWWVVGWLVIGGGEEGDCRVAGR